MVEEVFKNLVDQFSDPFTCLRELVQNAMDAGTEQIDIRTSYLSDPGGVCLEIRDFGEGMNRDIIDGTWKATVSECGIPADVPNSAAGNARR